ncbi:hypothetical protein RJ55_02302 [Drechmeria coniospora]|nr:hypothetical protein RJ55_02302 [Drechmeria coniospora]
MPPPTHFLCIPLSSPSLARSWASFRADVAGTEAYGVPEDAVRPLGTLHLTLGVMRLERDSLARAVEVLEGLRPREVLEALRAERRPSSSNCLTEERSSVRHVFQSLMLRACRAHLATLGHDRVLLESLERRQGGG